MNNTGQFVVLQSKADWDQVCSELATELARKRDQPSMTVEFTKHPDSYPCLAAMVVLASDPTVEGTIEQAQVLSCFVYPADAARLLEVEQEGQPELESTTTEEIEDAVRSQSTPSATAGLLLALVHELKEIGALRKPKLMNAMRRAQAWLVDNTEENETASVEEIVERFWESCDAR